jgi:amidase
MAVCWAITVTGCPAISIPAGFTQQGLPIGVQIVGPRGQDKRLIDIAHVLEQANPHALKRPQPIEKAQEKR